MFSTLLSDDSARSATLSCAANRRRQLWLAGQPAAPSYLVRELRTPCDYLVIIGDFDSGQFYVSAVVGVQRFGEFGAVRFLVDTELR